MADIAQELLDAQIQEVLATLDESAARIEIERRVVEGIPENRIVEIAEQIDAALLVMAADTERSLLGKWWSGSVVDSVKKHTERPLVILPNELPSLPQTERKDLHHNTMQFTH
jgi:nucleotide-binding universal stress UspA family protein